MEDELNGMYGLIFWTDLNAFLDGLEKDYFLMFLYRLWVELLHILQLAIEYAVTVSWCVVNDIGSY